MIGRGEVNGMAEESWAIDESVVTFPEVLVERNDCHVDAEVLEVEFVLKGIREYFGVTI